MHGQSRSVHQGGQAPEADIEEAVLQEVQPVPVGTDRLRRAADVGRGGEPLLPMMSLINK